MRIIYLILAAIFLVLGTIGLALPIIPQVPFLALGFIFLSLGSKKFRRFVESKAIYREHVIPWIARHPILVKLHGVAFDNTAIEKLSKEESEITSQDNEDPEDITS